MSAIALKSHYTTTERCIDIIIKFYYYQLFTDKAHDDSDWR